MGDVEYKYRWVSISKFPDRYGHPCKLVRGSRGLGFGQAIVIEFPDGLREEAMWTSVKLASRYLARGPRSSGSIQHKILLRIRSSPKRTFTPADFFDLGTATGGVGQALSRLVESRAIVRVARGQFKSRA